MQAISFSQETLVYDYHAEKSHPPYGLLVILLIAATISSNVDPTGNTSFTPISFRREMSFDTIPSVIKT